MRLFPRVIAASVVLLSVAFTIATVVLAAVNSVGARASVPLLVASLIFGVVGVVIVTRRPRNAIGWIFCAIGLIWTLGSVAVEYSIFATAGGGEPHRTAWIAAWVGEWNWIPFWFLTLVATPILFPTGSPTSRPWRRFLILSGASTVFMTVAVSFDPVLDVEGTMRRLANPIGVDGATWLDPDHRESLSSVLLFPVLFGSAAAAGTSIVLRFRRSRGEERLQLKWFAFAAVMMVTGWFVLALTSSTGVISAIYGLLVALLPIAAGIAILRYRLYDIDVVINRTLVYGLLTASLLGAYLLIVFALSRVLDPVTADSDIAIAASTLAVAALFRPLRSRIQAFIDRRFYRSRYDATRAVGEFAARLRDEVELDVVRSDMLGVVGSTLQPRHASLWLKTEAAR